MKNKLILFLTLMLLPFSCDEEEPPIDTFSITIDSISNTYPILISFSITNPDLISSIDFEVNNKLISTIENDYEGSYNVDEMWTTGNYSINYSPYNGFSGSLNFKAIAHGKDNVTIKSDEYSVDYNDTSTAINNDIIMINASNEFLFTKYLITNQNYIDYLNSISQLLVYENNILINSFNQNIIALNNSRIVFNESEQTFEIEDNTFLNHPVTGITWYGANSYATHFGWTLPTVEQWKWIASGDSTEWKYPYLNKQANHSWVDTSQANCNYNNQQNNTTNDVTKFESTRSYFGAVDIIGNVYELTNSKNEQSGLNVMLGGSYISECRFIDENNDGVEDTNFEPPELCLQDSCFSAIWNDISFETIGFRCIADIDYNHNTIEEYSDCNGTLSSDVGYGIFVDECGTCLNQISTIENYFCLSDCKGFWDNETTPENVLDDCGECDGGHIFTCNDGVRCTLGDSNICPDECAVSYQCSYQNIVFACNPQTSFTIGGITLNQCDDECTQVLNSIENNICNCNDEVLKKYYIDNDSDGDGNNSSEGLLSCGESIPDGYSDNNYDQNDDCYSNIIDCAETCDGTLEVDACNVCGGDGPQNYYQDADCDGLGNPDIYLELLCENPTVDLNEDDNCDSEDTYWVTNDTDDSDNCSGDVDLCGVCGGDDSSCEDCAGVPNGTSVEDECNVCDGLGAIYDCGCFDIPEGLCNCAGNINDCNGDCDGSATIDCYGQCAAGNTGVIPYEICGCFESGTFNFWCNDEEGICTIPSIANCQEDCIQVVVGGGTISDNPFPGDSLFDPCYICLNEFDVLSCIEECNGVYNDVDNCCFTGCNDDDAANYDDGCANDYGTCQDTDYIKFGEIDYVNSTIPVIIKSSQNIGGFQFNTSGIDISGASGGISASFGLTVSIGGANDFILGFTFTSDFIVPSGGEEILLEIEFNEIDEENICLPINSEFVFTTPVVEGNELIGTIVHYTSSCP